MSEKAHDCEGAERGAVATPSPSKTRITIRIDTYYLENQSRLDAYLERVRRRREKDWQEQQLQPSDFVQLLRERLDWQRAVLREEEGLYSWPDAEK